MGNRALRVIQCGKETVFGTPVAATAVFGGLTDATVHPMVTIAQRRYLQGDYAPAHAAVVTDVRGKAVLTGDFTCEDFPIIGNCALKGGVTGVVVDTTGYTYAFPFPLTASPALEFRTWEFTDQQQEYQLASGLVESFVLTGGNGIDAVVGLQVNLIGPKIAKGTLTGALSSRAQTVMPCANMKLYIDALGGTIGTTIKADTLINWTYTYTTGLHMKKFQAGGTNPTTWGYGVPSAKLQMTAEFNSVAVAEVDAMLAGTGRLVKIIGENGLAGSSTAKYTLDAQIAGDITDVSDLWSDRDGNTIADFTVSARYDRGTFANWGKINVINKVVTLPG